MRLDCNEEYFCSFKLRINAELLPDWMKEHLGDHLGEAIARFVYQDSLGGYMDSTLEDYMSEASEEFLGALRRHFPDSFDSDSDNYCEELDDYDLDVDPFPLVAEFEDFGMLADKVKELWGQKKYHQITNIAEGLQDNSGAVKYAIAVTRDLVQAPYALTSMPHIELYESEVTFRDYLVDQVAEEYDIPRHFLDYGAVFTEKSHDYTWEEFEGAVVVLIT